MYKVVMLHSMMGGSDSICQLIVTETTGGFSVSAAADSISSTGEHWSDLGKAGQSYTTRPVVLEDALALLRRLEYQLRKLKGYHSIGECAVCFVEESLLTPDKEDTTMSGRLRRFRLDEL